MEQTPLEKAIDLYNKCKSVAIEYGSPESVVKEIDSVIDSLTELIPYEKERNRYIAERAWDQGVYNLLVERGHIDDKHIGKEDYLNKYHPL